MTIEIKENDNYINGEIERILTNGIAAEAERIYDKQKEEAIKEFDRRKDEVVAGITLRKALCFQTTR